jgi:tRNA (cytidine/uridine-2'-O-)-methyltransferase
VLVEPEIHWNTGNAGRTCLAADARLHLVEPLGFSLDDREVRRAGLDYWPRVRPQVWPSWESLEEKLPELGEPFFFSAEAPRDLWSVRYPERVVLVFGRESAGLPLGMRKRFRDRLVAIPMLDPELRALNLSSSVAVALYEVLRQRAARTAEPERAADTGLERAAVPSRLASPDLSATVHGTASGEPAD